MDATLNSSSSSYFPSDVLKWMKKNAKPRMSLKLMQLCKYFKHPKFPYLVITTINDDHGGWEYSALEENESQEINSLDIFPDNYLWIIHSMYLNNENLKFSRFLSKVAVCDARDLDLRSQSLTVNEFKILTISKTFEDVTLIKTAIIDSDGEDYQLTALETILECLPNVSSLFFNHIVPSFLSLNAVQSIDVSKMTYFQAYHCSESFNFKIFSQFMKINPTIQFRIYFGNIFSTGYLNELQQFCNKIIQDDSIKNPPPRIQFPGQLNADAMGEIWTRYCLKSST